MTRPAVPTRCLGVFNVGAPAAGPFCGARGGFVGDMLNELLNSCFDNRPFTGPAVRMGIHGAITGAVLGFEIRLIHGPVVDFRELVLSRRDMVAFICRYVSA
ncbi:hypothetical protein ACFYY8_30600 [Streptosporangium sp. NPDC001559]|uniref:hypothetical protein n=1 Tax=Streptosporangium sp. NPDC001559 TaxID=3366187 RepID=UPI0036E472D1